MQAANRDKIVKGALAALSVGRAGAAAQQLRTYLSGNAQDVDARYHYARSLAALGEFHQAAGEFRRLLRIQPGHLAAITDLGIALALAGEHRDALAVLAQAAGMNPPPAELHFALGLCRLGLGDLPAAEASFREALARNLRIAEVYDHLGVAVSRQGRYPEAIEWLRQAIALNPGLASAQMNLGDALLRAGNAAAAVGSYRQAAALQPHDALVHASLGTALLIAGDAASAVISLERALVLEERLPDVAVNLGTALRRLNRNDEAAAMYARALTQRPDHPEALLEMGLLTAQRGDADQAQHLLIAARDQKPTDSAVALKVAEALQTLGRRAEALEVYERAAESGNADIHDAQGRLFHRLGRNNDALACYTRALALDPGRRETQLNRGNALESLGSIPDAIHCFQRVLAANPEDDEAIAGLASCGFRICDWSLAEGMVARLLERPAGIDALHPFLRFAADLEPAMLAASSRRTAQVAAQASSEASLEPYAHHRLRVAYLSPDFRQHPVAYALAAIIERHDRRRIEPIGVSLVAPDESDIAARLKGSFDEFIDCSASSDGEIVKLLRRREIDIAIDLGGFTAGARPAVFAARAAPVQVNYLGFPGSTGAGFMDFMIADEVVVPPADELFYAEKIVRLPHSYLPFDRDRSLGPRPADRIAAGLPATGPVFCAFSNGYKIARPTFDIWMRLLEEVPDSVLWLREGGTAMADNLVRAAQGAGIDAGRLVFSARLPSMDEHLRRLQLADLFLDTSPYNAHTTAAEALWAGVPVITCRGRSFAGRVGASLLTAAGLSELICEDHAGYLERAVHLARSPRELRELRARIEDSRATAALFDTGQYTRDLESALLGLWRRDHG